MLHDGCDDQREQNLERDRVEHKEQSVFQTIPELKIERRLLVQQNRFVVVQAYPSLVGNKVPLCE
jgi:hypothetical protein